MERIKLSELTFDKVKGLTMHEDEYDWQRKINSEDTLNEVRDALMKKYGDVDLVIDKEQPCFDKVVIDDEKWRNDHAEFCAKKLAWCEQYGCD